MAMLMTGVRRPATFRFSADLLETLKAQAKKCNCSLNKYVEEILLDSVYYEPNDDTKAAMEEAKKGKDLKVVDMSSFEAFVKSCSE